MDHPTDRITHTTAFVTPVMEYWLECSYHGDTSRSLRMNSSVGPQWRINPMTHRTMSEGFYHRATSRSLRMNSSMGPLHEGSIRRLIAPWANAVFHKIFIAYISVTHYQVTVFTGDHWAGGTEANVYIKLIGRKGDTGQRILYQSKSGADKFRKGQVSYLFQFLSNLPSFMFSPV